MGLYATAARRRRGELIVRMTKGETKVDYLGKPEASEEKTRGGWLRTGSYNFV